MPQCLRVVAILLGAFALAGIPAHQTGATEIPKREARLVQFAQPGTPEAIIQAALVAALMPDEDKGFEAYIALVHPSRKGKRRKRRRGGRAGAHSLTEQIRRYSWKRFRAQAADYVLPESNGGFTLARMDPPKLLPSTRLVRVFLIPSNNPRRTAATPVRLERSGDAWRITANSL
ncbi:MAG: hypothetical protein QF464_13970 [Myxococcota bacterium]|nr:hypothetical protein [Myxococcota bacterium]